MITSRLTADDSVDGDIFGISAALVGDTAVIGALFDDDNGVDSGSAYVYDFDGTTWVLMDFLTASDGATGDLFGSAVAIDGDRIVVGLYREDGSNSDSGAAYVFDFDETAWIETRKLAATDGASDDWFG